MGKWQFTHNTLQMLGYDISPRAFRKDPGVFPPELQYEALISLLRYNEAILSDFMDHYDGMIISHTLVTRGGMLAAAHLGGAGAVKAWLLSYGQVNPSDGHTRISDYMQYFSAYRLKKP
jgi:hypothetical protein